VWVAATRTNRGSGVSEGRLEALGEGRRRGVLHQRIVQDHRPKIQQLRESVTPPAVQKRLELPIPSSLEDELRRWAEGTEEEGRKGESTSVRELSESMR
jgi:hypothetical protein